MKLGNLAFYRGDASLFGRIVFINQQRGTAVLRLFSSELQEKSNTIEAKITEFSETIKD